jgi:hypothetical protein
MGARRSSLLCKYSTRSRPVCAPPSNHDTKKQDRACSGTE